MTILVKSCLHCQGKFSQLIKQASSLEDWGKTSESSVVIWPKPVTLQGGFNITAAGTVTRFLVDVTADSFSRWLHCHQRCILSVQRRPLSTSNPAMWPTYHGCLNTSWCTEGTSVWMDGERVELSGVTGGLARRAATAQRAEVRQGWELWVGVG